MQGGKNRQPLGYTIIEVMIVLAVSGLMFVIAASFVNGKQEKTAFTAGVGQLASNLQNTIEEISAGRYSDVSFSCTPNSSYQEVYAASSPTNPTQGTNPDCIFIGKFIHFNEKASGYAGSWNSSTDPSHYETFTLGGFRLIPFGSLNAGNTVASIAEAHPEPIQSINPSAPGSLDLTNQSITPDTLDVLSVKALDNDNKTLPNFNTLVSTWGFGFVQSVGDYSTGTVTSGAPSIQLVYVKDLMGSSTYDELGAIMAQNATQNGLFSGHPSAYYYASKAEVCVTDGVQYAKITVGDNNTSNLSVDVERVPVCS